MSERDLCEDLRGEGVSRLDEVAKARLERSGGLSVTRARREPRVVEVLAGRVEYHSARHNHLHLLSAQVEAPEAVQRHRSEEPEEVKDREPKEAHCRTVGIVTPKPPGEGHEGRPAGRRQRSV